MYGSLAEIKCVDQHHQWWKQCMNMCHMYCGGVERCKRGLCRLDGGWRKREKEHMGQWPRWPSAVSQSSAELDKNKVPVDIWKHKTTWMPKPNQYNQSNQNTFMCHRINWFVIETLLLTLSKAVWNWSKLKLNCMRKHRKNLLQPCEKIHRTPAPHHGYMRIAPVQCFGDCCFLWLFLCSSLPALKLSPSSL